MTSATPPARTAPSFGVDFIHEPVLSGALPANAENLTVFAQIPRITSVTRSSSQWILTCTPTATSGDCRDDL